MSMYRTGQDRAGQLQLRLRLQMQNMRDMINLHTVHTVQTGKYIHSSKSLGN